MVADYDIFTTMVYSSIEIVTPNVTCHVHLDLVIFDKDQLRFSLSIVWSLYANTGLIINS